MLTENHFNAYLESVRRTQNLPGPVNTFLDFARQYSASAAEQHQSDLDQIATIQQQLVRYKFQNLVLKAVEHNARQLNFSLVEENAGLTREINGLRSQQENVMSPNPNVTVRSEGESEVFTPPSTFITMNATQWKSFSIGVLSGATLLETSGHTLGHQIRPYSYAY